MIHETRLGPEGQDPTAEMAIDVAELASIALIKRSSSENGLPRNVLHLQYKSGAKFEHTGVAVAQYYKLVAQWKTHKKQEQTRQYEALEAASLR